MPSDDRPDLDLDAIEKAHRDIDPDDVACCACDGVGVIDGRVCNETLPCTTCDGDGLDDVGRLLAKIPSLVAEVRRVRGEVERLGAYRDEWHRAFPTMPDPGLCGRYVDRIKADRDTAESEAAALRERVGELEAQHDISTRLVVEVECPCGYSATRADLLAELEGGNDAG
jgi:hypothetical protein